MVHYLKRFHIVFLFSFSWVLFNPLVSMNSASEFEHLADQPDTFRSEDTPYSDGEADFSATPAHASSTTLTQTPPTDHFSESPFSLREAEEESDDEDEDKMQRYTQLQRSLEALTSRHAIEAFHADFSDNSPLQRANTLSKAFSEQQRKTAQAIREIIPYLTKATSDRTALVNFTEQILRTNPRLLRVLNHLYDESGQPDVGAWREIVLHIKKRRYGLGLHAEHDFLYQLRDLYTPEFINNDRSSTAPASADIPSQRPFAHLSEEEINLFLKIRAGILTGFERGTDTISAADLDMARTLRVDPANGAVAAYFTRSWEAEINDLGEKIREFKTASPRPHPLNGEFLPEYRFNFIRATPTAKFASEFFIDVLQRHCYPLQLVKYSGQEGASQIIIRGKVKNHLNQWWYIKLLGFPKSVTRSGQREARGRGFYLGWINPNVAHKAINFEVKEAPNSEDLMPSPASMKPLANGHLLIAFPSRENIRDAIKMLKAPTSEVIVVAPPVAAPSRTPLLKVKERKLQPFTGEEVIRKLLEKMERLASVATEAVERWKSADPSAETKQRETEELINNLTQTHGSFSREFSTLAPADLPAFWERLQTTANPLLESPKLQEAIGAARPKGFR